MTESPFSTVLPTLQLAWDSVSSGTFKECPRRYQLAHIEGWRARAESVDLAFGIFLHEAREVYHVTRATGASHDEGVEAALGHTLRATWDERAGRPWLGDERKNRFTLARTVVWYLDEWEHDPLVTVLREDGRPMVEASFRFPLGVSAPTGEAFALCGHLDRVAAYGDQWWVNDLKSTKATLSQESRGYFFSQFSPDNQISLYSYAGAIVLSRPIAGVMLDAVQVAADFTRCDRAPVVRTRSQLDEWLAGFLEMLERAVRYAQRGEWPMNEKACFRCPFRAVCARPTAERAMVLARDFERREVWNPLAVRGEVLP
jgi:PD-(D/E)XK nuclease superfamily